MRSLHLRTLAFAVTLLGAFVASASIHTWDVSEVFSNSDGTIQFVELKNPPGFNNETGVSNSQITSDLKTASWNSAAVSETSDKFYLIATQSFADLPGAPQPDAIIDASTLPFFFDPSGDTVDFSTWDSCTFTAGQVPTDGVGSYDCLLGASSVSATPTNFAGETFGAAAVPSMAPSMLWIMALLMLVAGGFMVFRRQTARA